MHGLYDPNHAWFGSDPNHAWFGSQPYMVINHTWLQTIHGLHEPYITRFGSDASPPHHSESASLRATAQSLSAPGPAGVAPPGCGPRLAGEQRTRVVRCRRGVRCSPAARIRPASPLAWAPSASAPRKARAGSRPGSGAGTAVSQRAASKSAVAAAFQTHLTRINRWHPPSPPAAHPRRMRRDSC